MDRRQFIPALAIIPWVAKQLIINRPATEPLVYELPIYYSGIKVVGNTITIIPHGKAFKDANVDVYIDSEVMDSETKGHFAIIKGKINKPIVLSKPIMINRIMLVHFPFDILARLAFIDGSQMDTSYTVLVQG